MRAQPCTGFARGLPPADDALGEGSRRHRSLLHRTGQYSMDRPLENENTAPRPTFSSASPALLSARCCMTVIPGIWPHPCSPSAAAARRLLRRSGRSISLAAVDKCHHASPTGGKLIQCVKLYRFSPRWPFVSSSRHSPSGSAQPRLQGLSCHRRRGSASLDQEPQTDGQ
ncbi:hypothetical protein BJY59DRAFT_705050 [Rhodotorula toruloides]